MLTIRISLGSDHGGMATGDTFVKSTNSWGRAQSLSPISRGKAGVRAAVNAEVLETHAQMAVIADATETASLPETITPCARTIALLLFLSTCIALLLWCLVNATNNAHFIEKYKAFRKGPSNLFQRWCFALLDEL